MLHDQLDRTAVRGDGADDVVIRLQRIAQGAFWSIAEEVDTRREPTIENHVELTGERCGPFALQSGVEIPDRGLGAPVPPGGHEPEHRPARRITPERILGRFGLGGRSGGRGGSRLRLQGSQLRLDERPPCEHEQEAHGWQGEGTCRHART